MEQHGWVKRSTSMAIRKEAEAIVLREMQRIGVGDLRCAPDVIRDAEMYLRMGYIANEISAMLCSSKSDPQYYLYPKSASKLKGRPRG